MPYKAPPVCPQCNSSRLKGEHVTETYTERLNADPSSPEITYPVTVSNWSCQRCAYKSAPESDQQKERDRARQKFWLARIRAGGYSGADATVDQVRIMFNKVLEDSSLKGEWLLDWILHGEKVI